MSFSLDLSKFAKGTEEKLEKTKRAVTLKLFSAIVLDTPVDTGRLRGNWQISIAAPKTGTLAREDKSGSTVNSEIKATVEASKLGDTVILRNNLPYAHRIEYDGWSKVKAPQGMVRRNLLRFERLLKKAAAEGKL